MMGGAGGMGGLGGMGGMGGMGGLGGFGGLEASVLWVANRALSKCQAAPLEQLYLDRVKKYKQLSSKKRKMLKVNKKSAL
jgi:hypothetical protein